MNYHLHKISKNKNNFIRRLSGIFLFLAFSWFSALPSPAAASINIKLKKNTSPKRALVGLGNIKITGTVKGDIAEDIDLTSFNVTLAPKNSSANSVTISADRAELKPEKKRKKPRKKRKVFIYFTVPYSLDIDKETLYLATAAGVTLTGETVLSSNASRVKIRPLKLKLNKLSPKRAKPGTENIKLTGRITSWEDIDLTSFTLTLSPKALPGTGAVTVVANRVELKDERKKHRYKQKVDIFFTLPNTINVSAPTRHIISVLGKTVSGKTFHSFNTAGIKILPGEEEEEAKISVYPANNGLSTGLSVTITGTNTNFSEGTTSANFGPGISVGNAPAGEFGPVTVNSATEAIAQITIQSGSVAGTRDITVTDGTNNYPLTQGFTLVEQVSPEITIPSPAANALLNTSAITVTGTVTDSISSVQGVTVQGVAASINGNTFTANEISLTEGNNIITASALDAEGNTANSTLTVILDSTAPVIEITSPADGSVFPGNLVTITGTVDDINSTVSINNGTTLLSESVFTAELTLNEGSNTITAEAVDEAGNTGTASLSLVHDSPPTVTITSPPDLITIGTSPIEVCGTIDDPFATLTVNGIQTSHGGGQYCIQGVVLEEGMNSIAATAIDTANNVSTYTINLVLDSTPPNMAVLSPDHGYTTTSSTITVTGTINDVVRGTVNEDQGSVSVNGITATVANRNFIAESVPLNPG